MRSRRRHDRIRKFALILALGVALVRGRALRAQNLVPNGDFHESIAGWSLEIGTQLVWSAEYDESECAGSGVAVMSSAPVNGGQRTAIERCVVLPAVDKLSLGLYFATTGKLAYGFDLFATTTCTGPVVGGFSGEAGQDELGWKSGTASVPVPPEAASALIYASSWAPNEHLAGVDAFVLSVDEPIFLDGFEGNPAGTTTPCRWCTNCG